MIRRVLIFVCVGAVMSSSAWAQGAQRTTGSMWADDLKERLEDFQDSVGHLQDSNAAIAAQNKALKERIAQEQSKLEALKLTGKQLQTNADLYASKTENKSVQLKQIDAQVQDIQEQIKRLDEQIADKQKTLEQRTARQELVWRQLTQANTAAPSNPPAPADYASEIAQKTMLTRRLDEIAKHSADLESKIAYESMLRMDPSVSVPNLKVQRDTLRRKLADVNAKVPASKTPTETAEAQKITAEIAELNKRRSEKANLLKILQTQYNSTNQAAKHSLEEKKLQTSLASLKRDNQLLILQSTELQVKMVELDKRKSRLERVVNSAKRP